MVGKVSHYDKTNTPNKKKVKKKWQKKETFLTKI